MLNALKSKIANQKSKIPKLLFRDRTDAGQRLAARLGEYAGRSGVLILALPRGGLPVAFEVARSLRSPLGVFLVRKLGVPGHEELAMGAIATGGVCVVNEAVVRELGIGGEAFEEVAARERTELERRERAYLGDVPAPEARGRTVILVDDGLATGSTMRAAAEAVRRQGPERVVVAVPVASRETCEELRAEVDEVVCAETPEPFRGVGRWYQDFSQTTDEEVRELLAKARQESDECGMRNDE
jgi:predicted phosphoribosyltransferase